MGCKSFVFLLHFYNLTPAPVPKIRMTETIFKKALLIDQDLSGRLSAFSQNKLIRKSAALFAHSGDSWFWLAGLLLVILFIPGAWRTTALIMTVGIFVTAGLIFVIKKIVRRPRPAGDWGNIYRRTDPHSFPSGHAARAAMLALIATAIGPPILGWILILWAPLVIISRVIMGVHYLSDVIAGALIGTASALAILFILQVFSFPV